MLFVQDNSDAQYRSFRGNVPVLTALVALFLGVKIVYTQISRRGSPRRDNLYLIPFLVTFSFLFLMGLHGTSIVKVLIILSINYLIATLSGASKAGPVLTWVFNMAILFANETYSGYKFASVHPSLALLVSLFDTTEVYVVDGDSGMCELCQDSIQGVYPRWYISFNITMLRLVSFNMDYYWACNGVGTPDVWRFLWSLPDRISYNSITDRAVYDWETEVDDTPYSWNIFIQELPCLCYISSIIHRRSHYDVQ